jgi:putative ABC transport system permease protein
MFRNYLKTALRSLLRHRFFSAINVFGLAVSMSICMGIIMLVADQMMYDRYNTKKDRIYRVNSMPIGKDGQELNEAATTTLPVKEEISENFSGIEKAVRIVRGFGNNWLAMEIGQNVNVPVAGYFADPEVLDFFEYELEYGDSKTALVQPFSVVLTKKSAKKLFPKENPVGEMLKVGEGGLYKVTGVLKETDHKSHIVFDALASLSTVQSLEAAGKREKSLDDWYNYTEGWVYVILEDGKTQADLQPYLNNIQKKHFSELTNPDTQRKVKYIPQPMMEITPGAFINNPIGPFLPWLFIYFFAGLAAIVMLTSCFNFTNLSIARSLTRAKEIGVRKVTGAMRWQIFVQFLTESVLTALFSLVVAFVLLFLLKPLMMELSFARMMKWDLESNYFVYGIFFVFAIVVGILAGIFPAIVLSGFQPVKVLKSLNTVKLFSKMGLRKALLVSQFTFSLIFILTVIIVFQQLRLFLRADHGFSMESKVMLHLNKTSPDVLKNELMKYPNIESVTATSHLPAAGVTYGASFKKSLDEKDWTSVDYFSADADYLRIMEIPLVAGRFFLEKDGVANKNFIVLNEQSVAKFNFKSPVDALGQEIILQKDSSRKQIIGVVKNYNHQMLMEKIEPMALVYDTAQFDLLLIKYSGTFPAAGKAAEEAWAKVNPAFKVDLKDFKYEVLKLYDVLFGSVVNILGVVSFLAILISCLGLLGMATYATETRVKEISIRKILGSDNTSLVYLLSKGFVMILIVSILIAVPIAYLLNNLWLEKLAYHITIGPGIISLGVSLLLVFGAITIGSQTWRATFVNPVDNLKGE